MPISYAVIPPASITKRNLSSVASGRSQSFSPPVECALKTLNGRAVTDGRGHFSCDGRPVPLRTVIREANRIRALRDLKPIPYPGESVAREGGR
jgi:hypothetical protein